ncbi:MAG: HEAT repeat domain-containing protein [Fuerstiella sp.]
MTRRMKTVAFWLLSAGIVGALGIAAFEWKTARDAKAIAAANENSRRRETDELIEALRQSEEKHTAALLDIQRLQAASERTEAAVESQSADESEGDATAATSRPSPLSPAVVLDTYQQLAEGRLAQARSLKTAKVAGRQSSALRLIRQAAELRSTTDNVLKLAGTDSQGLEDSVSKFWANLMPQLRNEAIDWLSETSLLAVKEHRWTVSNRLQVDNLTAISPDGRTAAVFQSLPIDRTAARSSKIAGKIRIYDLKTGDPSSEFDVSIDQSSTLVAGSLFFQQNGKTLALATLPRMYGYGRPSKLAIQRFDAATGEADELQEVNLEGNGHSQNLSLQAIADGELILLQGDVWNVADGRQIRSFSGDEIVHVGSGKYVLVMKRSASAEVDLVDVELGTTLRSIKLPESVASNLMGGAPLKTAVASDMNRLVSFFKGRRATGPTASNTLVISDSTTGNVVAEYPLAGEGATFDVSSDGRFIAAISSASVMLIDARSGVVLKSAGHPPPPAAQAGQQRSSQPGSFSWKPLSIGFVPNQTKLVTVMQGMHQRRSSGTLLQLWDMSISQTSNNLVFQQKHAVTDIAVGGANRGLVSSGADGAIREFDAKGEQVWGTAVERPHLVAVSNESHFDSAGKSFRVAIQDNVRWFDVATGMLRKELPREHFLAAAANGNLAIIRDGNQDRQVVIYDIASDKILTKFADARWQKVRSVRFSPDNRHVIGVVPVGGGLQILVSQIADGQTVSSINGETASNSHLSFQGANNVAISSDGTKLALVRTDRSQQPVFSVYNLPDGQKAGEWRIEHGEKPTNTRFSYKLAFDNSDHHLLIQEVVGFEVSVHLWDLNDPEGKKVSSGWYAHQVQAKLLIDGTRVLITGQKKPEDRPFAAFELWDADTGKILASGGSAESNSTEVVHYDGADTFAVCSGRYDSSNNQCEVLSGRTGEVVVTVPQQVTKKSPDGRFLILENDSDHMAQRVVDLSNPERKFSITGDVAGFSPDGRYCLTNAIDAKTRATTRHVLWDLEEGRSLEIDLSPASLKYGSFVPVGGRIPFSRDGRFLVMKDEDATLKILDLKSEKPVGNINLRHGNFIPESESFVVSGFEFNPDASQLAIQVNGQIRFYDLANGSVSSVVPRAGHLTGSAQAVTVSPDARYVVSGSRDRTVCVWSRETGAFLSMLDGFESPVADLAFSLDGRRIAVLESAGHCSMWSVATDDRQGIPEIAFLWRVALPPSENSEPPQQPGVVTFDKADGYIAVSSNVAIQLLDVKTGKLHHQLVVPDASDAVVACRFTPDAGLVAAYGDGTIRVWDTATHSVARSWHTGQTQLAAIAVNDDASLLATAGDDVRIWQLNSSELLFRVNLHKDIVSAIAFHSGNRLVSASRDGTFVVWKPEDLRTALIPLGLDWSTGSPGASVKQDTTPDESLRAEGPPTENHLTPKEIITDASVESAWDVKEVARISSTLKTTFEKTLKAKPTDTYQEEYREETQFDLSPLEQVLESAGSTDKETRRQAVVALGQRFQKNKLTLPVLLSALKDADLRVRDAAVEALGATDAPGAIVVQPLLDTIRDAESIRSEVDVFIVDSLQRSITMQLVNYGSEAVSPLAAALSDKDAIVRKLAVMSLAQLGESAVPAVAALTEAATDPETEVRERAIYALGRIGPKAISAVAALKSALDDESDFVRQSAARSIWLVTDSSEGLVSVLADIIESRSEGYAVRYAAETLASFGEDAQAALPALRTALANSDEQFCLAVAGTILTLSPNDEDALNALLTGFQTSQFINRQQLWKLRLAGPEARKKIVETATPWLHDARYRVAAASVLGAVGPAASAAVPTLRPFLKDRDRQLQRATFNALTQMGPEGLRVVIEETGDSEEQFGQIATQIFGIIAPRPFGLMQAEAQGIQVPPGISDGIPDGNEHVAGLIDLFGDDNARVSATAVFLLGRIGGSAAVAVQTALANADGKQQKTCAILMLAQLDNTTLQAEKLIVGQLTDSDADVRWAAMKALSEFEQLSEAANAALKSVAEVPDEE